MQRHHHLFIYLILFLCVYLSRYLVLLEHDYVYEVAANQKYKSAIHAKTKQINAKTHQVEKAKRKKHN